MGKKKVVVDNSHWGYVLFVAYIGAVIYFLDRNEGFWGGVLAFLQAAVWPAYVLHAVLGLLNV
jgi:hypothetical protein